MQDSLKRYIALRAYFHSLYPDVFTDVSSGLPKKPLGVGIRHGIAISHGQWTPDSARAMFNLSPKVTRPCFVGNKRVRLERGDGLVRAIYWGHKIGLKTFDEDLSYFLRTYCSGIRYHFACRIGGRARVQSDGTYSNRDRITPAQATYHNAKIFEYLSKNKSYRNKKYKSLLAAEGPVA